MTYMICIFCWYMCVSAVAPQPLQTIAAQGQQKMHITDHTVDLDSLLMKKMVSYIMWAPSNKVEQAFEAMTLQRKLMFLKRMNIHQYGWFLFAFSEEQWHAMWQRLPCKQQQVIPPTRCEQLCMIRDCWLACSGGDVIWHAGGTRDPLARDLPFYRNRALERLHSFKTDDLDKRNMEYRQAVFYQWLHNYFDTRRLKLLKAF